MALTKTDIVEKVWEQLGCDRKKAIEIKELFIETIKSTLESGEDVLVSGFGKFCVKEKAERKDRNPATGETLMLEPRRVVAFKRSENLRAKVNGK